MGPGRVARSTARCTYLSVELFVTEGNGLVQRRGAPIEVIRPGDRVFFEPGEDHWHGAARNRFMTHLSMVDVDDKGNRATWGAPVSEDEYAAAPKIEET
jgi:quercetin dioxygenase-like cupin family protein